MRYFFAILSLLVAVVLLVLGVGQRTFLAGPKTIEEVIETSAFEENFLVLPAGIFEGHPGNPSVVLAGQDLFVAYGQQRDVAGWLEPFDYLTAETDEDGALQMIKVASSGPEETENETDADQQEEPDAEESATTVLEVDPAGSDLWLSEYVGDTSLTVAMSLESSQAVLITSGSESKSLPAEVTLMWAQARNTPLAGPLLLAGGIFAALGAVLYLIALDHDRRGLGPRRGRRGPFQGLRNKRVKLKSVKKDKTIGTTSFKKIGYAVGLAAIGSLVLSSCDASYWPQMEEVEEPLVVEEHETPTAVVPVSDTQLEKIIEDIVATVTESDLELDATDLKARFGETALKQREANYKIRKEEDDWRALPFLTTERAGYDLIQSTEKWPRTVFVTLNSVAEIDLESEEESESEASEIETDSKPEETEAADTADNEPEELTPTMALVLQQENPHENFKVERIVELRGGIEMPEAAPLSEGTAVLGNDIQTLQMTPLEATQSLAAVMLEGEESEEYEFFDFNEETLIEKMGGAWAKTQCVEDLQCSAAVSVDEDSIITLSTGQSGALVLATVIDKHNMKVDSERSIVKLSKVERALGLDGTYSSVNREWMHQVLMYVPGQDSDKKITILGSSSELVGASGEKAKIDID